MNDSQTIVVGAPAPELLTRAEDMLALAQSYAIDCPEMREAAAEDLKRVKGQIKQLEAEEKAITSPLTLAHKRVKDWFRKPLEFLERAESTIKRACLTWDDAQDRIRRAAEAEAARKADAERKRLADEAAKQAAAGNTETAHAITQAAQMVAPIPVAREAPKIAGESTREVWHAELVDIVALARAVAEGKASPECIVGNMPVLNGQARALKGSLQLPGVKAVCERVLSSRAA